MAHIALMILIFIVGDEPRTAREYYARGQVNEQNKRHEAALADYAKAVELDPRLLDAWFTRSSLYSQREEYAKSIADLTKVIELNPGDFPALFNRALYREQLGDYDGAIAGYSEALGDDADFSRSGSSKEEDRALAHHYRGRVYQWHKHDYAKAVADYTEALQLDPKIEMVRHRRGDAYHSLKEYAKAEQDYAAALKESPDYPNLLAHVAWQSATCPDPKFRDGARAVELAAKAVDAFDGKIPEHLDALAAAYAEAGRFPEAIEKLKRALETLGDKDRKQRQAMRERLELYQSGRPFRE